MRRIAVGIEYDGSHAHGWQIQSHSPNTIQEAVETALSRVANHPVRTVCAGRTDAGVHATQQVVHFDSAAERSDRAWVMGANRWLPSTVALKWAAVVPLDFHARFSATSRRYRYLIFNRPVRQALLSTQLTWYYRPLDAEAMNEAAQLLLGKHDFTSYRAIACQAKTSVRTIHDIRLSRTENILCLHIEANGFLQHMVRNIMGVLLAIGEGSRPVKWAADVLAAKDRCQGGVTAPPNGLYFLGPQYEPHFEIPQASMAVPQIPL